jgi:chromosome segregation ATPase
LIDCQFAQIGERLTKLEKQMADINQLVADQAAEIAELNTEVPAFIDAVNAKVADLSSQIAALKGTVPTDATISTLTANSQAIAEDLNTMKAAVANLNPAPQPEPTPEPTPEPQPDPNAPSA